MQNPTLVVLTDRNDLDQQLFGTFSHCADLFGQAPQQVEEVAEGMEDAEKAKTAGKWSSLEKLAGSSERLDELAALIVEHFGKRQQAIQGKGMIVCMSCLNAHYAIDIIGDRKFAVMAPAPRLINPLKPDS